MFFVGWFFFSLCDLCLHAMHNRLRLLTCSRKQSILDIIHGWGFFSVSYAHTQWIRVDEFNERWNYIGVFVRPRERLRIQPLSMSNKTLLLSAHIPTQNRSWDGTVSHRILTESNESVKCDNGIIRNVFFFLKRCTGYKTGYLHIWCTTNYVKINGTK